MWFIIQLATDTRNVELYKIEPINALLYIITYQIYLGVWLGLFIFLTP